MRLWKRGRVWGGEVNGSALLTACRAALNPLPISLTGAAESHDKFIGVHEKHRTRCIAPNPRVLSSRGSFSQLAKIAAAAISCLCKVDSFVTVRQSKDTSHSSLLPATLLLITTHQPILGKSGQHGVELEVTCHCGTADAGGPRCR